MNRNIKALCPDIFREVQVLDDWYPSFYKNNKLYVCAEVVAVDAETDTIMKDLYNSTFYDDNGNKYRYCVGSLYGGADDTMLIKEYLTNDIEEAVKNYRQFKSLLNKLQKSHPRNLKSYLYNIGFKMF